MRPSTPPLRRPFALGLLTLAAALTSVAADSTDPLPASPRLRALVIVVDGLRPDHLTPALTPTLAALASAGVTSVAHHSVYPTVTRVNATSLATGVQPMSHGILDNTIYLPAVDSARALNTGDAAVMQRADRVLGGRLITAPTIHELLAAGGMRTVVASAGSSGSAYLLAGAGKAPVFAAGLILPEALAPVVHARVGEAPGEERSTAQINAWAVDALLRVGIDSLDSDIAFLWLTDPDHSVHGAGLGSAIADSVIRGVDRDIARLLQELDTRGLRELVDILVVSDHGFSTHAGVGAPFTRVLAPFREHVVMAGSAVYLRAGSEHMRGQVVTALQSAAEVGAVFTAGQAQGGHGDVATGTLPLSSVSWAHARAGDILFSANWSHAPNAKGIAGWSAQGGVAGHGTTSPYDVGATFIAAGPHIRRGITSRVPSGNVDVAPTLLTLLGVPVPPHMQGRALTEILREGPEPGSVAVRREQEHAEATLGGDSSLRYRVTLFSSTVGTTRYMDSTTTTREPVRVPE